MNRNLNTGGTEPQQLFNSEECLFEDITWPKVEVILLLRKDWKANWELTFNFCLVLVNKSG